MSAELKNKYADETLEQLSKWLESQGQSWMQKHYVEDYRNHKHKSAQAATMERLFYQIKHRLDDAIMRRFSRNCDITDNPDELHRRFVEHCNNCNAPGGCCHRRDTRGMLSVNCASILKCFARFAIAPAEGGEKE